MCNPPFQYFTQLVGTDRGRISLKSHWAGVHASRALCELKLGPEAQDVEFTHESAELLAWLPGLSRACGGVELNNVGHLRGLSVEIDWCKESLCANHGCPSHLGRGRLIPFSIHPAALGAAEEHVEVSWRRVEGSVLIWIQHKHRIQ